VAESEEYAWEKRGAQVLRGFSAVNMLEVCLKVCSQRYRLTELLDSVKHFLFVQVALDIARGLHFLHSSGVIHRCRTLPMSSVMQQLRRKTPLLQLLSSIEGLEVWPLDGSTLTQAGLTGLQCFADAGTSKAAMCC
jgi:hypothetical protein